jgi:hypothetical protein
MLNNSQKEMINRKIDFFFDEIILKYEENKYDEKEYDRLKCLFENAQDVKKVALRHALMWKYGKKTFETFKRNESHVGTVDLLWEKWPIFVKRRLSAGQPQFDFLFSNAKKTQYISVAFICHLLSPDEVPIIDQHNFRALQYFLHDEKYPENVKMKPNSWDDIQSLKSFIDQFTCSEKRNRRELD